MTTVLSELGEVVLPTALREQLKLLPGDDLEVEIEDENTILLRRVSRPANQGLTDLLLSCPFPFEVPAREKDDSAPLVL